MASPFRFFRRHQTWFYVILGVLLMFAFVVLPPVADYLSRNPSGQAKDPTIVRWKYGEITRSELARRMRAEYVIQDFQQELFQRAIAKKGRPKAAFIRRAESDRELVQRLLLAKKAESLGIVISEEALLDFFDLISDHSLSNRSQYLALLRQIAKDRASSAMVLNQIRIDLLAQRMREIAFGSQAAYPPGELWQYYQKLNRMVVCDILPVRAEDYLNQVAQSPSEAELRKIYEEGKNEYPSPLSPKPAFKIRRKASFGYFKAELSTFLDKKIEKLLPTITDEEIKDYYEKNKLLFQEIDTPEAPPKPEENQPKEENSTEKTSKQDEKPSGDAKPASGKKAPEKKATPDHSGGPTPPKPSSSPSSSQNSTSKPEEKATKQNGGNAPRENKSADPSDKDPSDKDEGASRQSRVSRSGSTQFIAFQEEPVKTAEKKGEKKGEKKAESPKESAKENSQKKASADTKTGAQAGTKDRSKADKEGQAKAAPPMVEQPKKTAPSDQPGEAASPSQPKMKFRPLDEKLKEEIRRRIAREKATPQALSEMQLALETARRSVERYANALALSKDPELKRDAPPVPDFAGLAKQYGLTYQTTPFFDLLELQQLSTAPPDESRPYLDLLRVSERRSGNFGPTSVRFVDVAARMLNAKDPADVPLYQPQTIQATGGFGPPNASFLFWIREVQPERVPKFPEIRDQVAQFWRQREAFRRAADAAKKLVDQATTAKKPLKEVLSEEQKQRLVTTEPFSWMTTGATGGIPMLSPVRGKNGKGEEVTLRDLGDPFMEKVFALKPGGKTTAHDLPEKTAFAVEMVREVTKPEDLRELFLASGNDRILGFLVQRDRMQLQSKWLKQLEEEFEVEWLEDQA